ncbi:MAG: ATPase, T2SS/T4P/T4SS family [Nitrospirota bacterium]
MVEKLRLGELLVDAGIITREQLEVALAEKKRSRERLGKVLVKLKFTTEGIIMDFLASQLGMEHVNLAEIDIQPFSLDVRREVLESIVRRHMAIPIGREEPNTLVVAMADPLDVFALDDIKRATGCRIKPVVASEEEIKEVIEKSYGKKEHSIEEIMKGVDEKAFEVLRPMGADEAVDISKMGKDDEAPIIKLVNHVLSEAINSGASDIHLEPYQKDMRLRYRIDGILYEMPSPPKIFHPALVSRVKIIANLDIAEKRLPQDGRAKVIISNREADLRISIIPTIHGEKVVIRILDPKSLCVDLSKLGFDKEALAIYERNIVAPYGIIFITGPTGSGKSTTLYSTLRTINAADKNIVTVEDPVEYMLRGINQVQVKPEIGLDFPDALRSFMRQDPDVILVGEVRDRETSEVAINSALTGHLVFSTLHTNDAPGAITRLLNMGVEPFLITSTVIMCISQRLIRVICPNCKESYDPSPALLKEMGIQPQEGNIKLYHGAGCKKCSNTGYKGRIGTFEVLELDDEIRELILARESAHIIKEVAKQKGMVSLRQATTKKVLAGITTIEELVRVSFEERTITYTPRNT